jgi:hypothetical protein
MRFVREPDAFWDVVDGATIVCKGDQAKFFRLNDSALLLWNDIDGATLEDLLSTLAARFPDVDRDVLRADATAFVEALRSRGLVTTGDA